MLDAIEITFGPGTELEKLKNFDDKRDLAHPASSSQSETWNDGSLDSRQSQVGPIPFAKWEGRCLVIFGIAILGLLLVTRFLQPDASGMGTHQKLGLPACGSMALFGIPCPSCGMTTSWAWLTRGQVIHSWNANPGGFALGLFVLVMAPWMLVSGIKGHWWPMECQPLYVLYAGLSVIGLAVLQWVIRIMT